MSNRIQLLTGIICIVIAAILLLGNFLGDSSFPVILGVLGITAIAVSRRSEKPQI